MSKSVDGLEVLVVCTANICRSPAAAAILSEKLAARGVDACVTSAGASVPRSEAPADDMMATVLRRRGLSIDDHRNRPLEPNLVRGSDLVITMERRHLREAAVMAAGSWGHVYTLKELVRRASAIGPRGVDETLAEWLAVLHDGRTSAALISEDPDDDVRDPTGGTLSQYEATMAELESLVAEFVALGFPAAA